MSYVCDIKQNEKMNKTEEFSKELQSIAELAKILSHPARLAILQYLAKCKTCISGDISDFIPLSRTTVSQHLQELKKVGLIKGEIDGLKIYYCIDHEKLNYMKELFGSFFNTVDSDCTNC